MLRVHNLLVTLDGYATGDGQSLDAAFGHAQDEFLHWFGRIRIWRGLQPDASLGPDEAIAAAWDAVIGAEIMGRNKFRPTAGPWPNDGWVGWWGDEEPPFHTPCFVMTHYPREPLAIGDTTFHFVSGTPAEVLALAEAASGGLDVRLGGGPTTVNEFLAAGLVDYLHVVVRDRHRPRRTAVGRPRRAAPAVRRGVGDGPQRRDTPVLHEAVGT